MKKQILLSLILLASSLQIHAMESDPNNNRTTSSSIPSLTTLCSPVVSQELQKLNVQELENALANKTLEHLNQVPAILQAIKSGVQQLIFKMNLPKQQLTHEDQLPYKWNISERTEAFSSSSTYLASGYEKGINFYSLKDDNFTFITDLTDHNEVVLSVTFSPCDTYLASASMDGTVCLYAVNNGNPILIKKITDPNNYLTHVAFSPCDIYLAAASSDKTICLYAVNNGDPILIKKITDHNDYLSSVAFSPGGTYLAATSSDKTIYLYAVNNGDPTLIKKITDHNGLVKSFTFSPCENYLVAALIYSTICLYSLSNTNPTLIKKITDHNHSMRLVSISPCGNYLFSAYGNKMVSLYELDTLKLANYLNNNEISIEQALIIMLALKADQPLDLDKYPRCLNILWQNQELLESLKDTKLVTLSTSPILNSIKQQLRWHKRTTSRK